MLEPKRERPKRDNADPNRAKLRTEKLLPKCALSKIDTELPMYATPYTESEEPNRLKDRIDSTEPTCRKSSTWEGRRGE